MRPKVGQCFVETSRMTLDHNPQNGTIFRIKNMKFYDTVY